MTAENTQEPAALGKEDAASVLRQAREHLRKIHGRREMDALALRCGTSATVLYNTRKGATIPGVRMLASILRAFEQRLVVEDAE